MTEIEQRKIFGKNLKHWLTVRGVKQVDLAEKLGVSEGTVSQWISGRNMPKMGKVQRITDILDINMTDLYDDHETVDEFRQEMFDKDHVLFDYTQLSPENKKTVRNIIDALKAQENNGNF